MITLTGMLMLFGSIVLTAVIVAGMITFGPTLLAVLSNKD